MRTKAILPPFLGLLVGLLLGRACATRSAAPDSPAQADRPAASQVWTCSMHPQIRQPAPGPCPLCGMDLIPAAAQSAGANAPRELALGPAARKLAEIETAPVERRFVDVEVRMVGKVQFDETRLATIAARVPGRLDRIYANVTGTPVKPGEHLADLYSPDLVAAQRELIEALGGPTNAAGPAEGTPPMAVLAREKLRRWGLTPEQIGEVERSRQARDHLTLYAPIGGTVIEKEAREGLYVETGMRLYTVADTTQVWVNLDAYESDLGWLRPGQDVEFVADAYPGEAFHGRIALLAPTLDPMTRTVKVRVNAPNAEGRLRPEMFVRATVRARAAEGGVLAAPDWRDRWTCTMHPDVASETAGRCPSCDMPLVRVAPPPGATAEAGGQPRPPLVVPATAPLVTGRRAVVYVAKSEGVFEGRDVILGPRAGEFYVVREGLREGERVVVNGNFKLDSSLQIRGQRSMMTGDGEEAPGDEKKVSGHEKKARGEAAAGTEDPATKPQTHCPVMGGEISREVYADYQGQRVFFCCPGCQAPFLKEPEKYLAKMRAEGVRPEPTTGSAKPSHAAPASEHRH